MLDIICSDNFLYAFLYVFVCIGAGYFFSRSGIVKSDGKKAIKTIVWKLALPCMAFISFMRDFNTDDLKSGSIVLGSSLAFYLVFIFLGILIFRKLGKDKAIVASALGSIGQLTLFTIPLLYSLGEETAIFYCNIMTLSFRFVLYYVASPLISSGKQNKRKIFLTPVMISMLLATVIWVSQGFVPESVTSVLRIDKSLPFVYEVMEKLAALVSPLAMILVGINIGESKLSACIKNIPAWISAFMRAIACPLTVYLITSMLPAVFSRDAVIALTLGFAAPSSVTLCIFCSDAEKEEELAAYAAALSAVICLVTIPVFSSLVLS